MLTAAQKALEDAANRKATAADRMQQRYRELEEAKHARKIVVVDKLTVPTKGKAAKGRHGGMVFARAGQPRGESALRSSVPAKRLTLLAPVPTTAAAPKGIFNKARAEAQRAKVALTHASGKFDPKVANRLVNPVKRPQQTTTLFQPPRPTEQAPKKVVDGPRIPASRGIRGSSKRDREDESPGPLPLPGARPHVAQRSTLPASITHRPVSSPTTTGERFKLDPGRLEPIKRPRVENFAPPRAPTASLSLGKGLQPISGQSPSSTSASGPPRRIPTPTEEAARMNSVLFVKKKPPRPPVKPV